MNLPGTWQRKVDHRRPAWRHGNCLHIGQRRTGQAGAEKTRSNTVPTTWNDDVEFGPPTPNVIALLKRFKIIADRYRNRRRRVGLRFFLIAAIYNMELQAL